MLKYEYMTERVIKHEPDGSQSELSLPGMMDIVAQWERQPMGNDERHRAFALATGYLIAHDDRLKNLLQEFVDYQTNEMIWQSSPEPHDRTSYQGVNHFLRALHHVGMILEQMPEEEPEKHQNLIELGFLPADRPTSFRFPRDYKQPEAWESLIKFSLENDFINEILHYDLNYRHVQTNVRDRYKGVHIPLASLAETHFGGQPIRWLDIGPSIGLGPKAELMHQRLSTINAYRHLPALAAGQYQELFDPRLSGNMDRVLDQPIEYEKVVGVDLAPFNEWIDVLWVRSSYYTSELLSQGIMRNFDQLRRYEDPRYHFRLANFALASSVKEFNAIEPGKYHVVSALTVTNQLNQKETDPFERNSLDQLEPGGVFINQDFVIDDWSQPYSYRTRITIPDVAPKPVEIIWWKNGRCNEMIVPPGVDLFDLAGTVRRLGH